MPLIRYTGSCDFRVLHADALAAAKLPARELAFARGEVVEVSAAEAGWLATLGEFSREPEPVAAKAAAAKVAAAEVAVESALADVQAAAAAADAAEEPEPEPAG